MRAKQSNPVWIAASPAAPGNDEILSLLQRALERMLVLPGEVDHLGDLGFGHFIGEDAANGDALLVYLEHDSRGIFEIHREIALQNEDHELHRSIVVVEHQYFIIAGLFGPRTSARNDAVLDLVEPVALPRL